MRWRAEIIKWRAKKETLMTQCGSAVLSWGVNQQADDCNRRSNEDRSRKRN